MQKLTKPHYLLPAFVGFCIMCLALGLGRFAYTPLLPEMVAKHWLLETVASYIGSANFLGYLCGALIAKKLTDFKPGTFWIKVNICLCTLSLIACIIHMNAIWLLIWRIVAGVSGAILMVLTPPVIYRATHREHIGLVSGIMFGGIGIGIIYGALIIPALQHDNLDFTWAAIAAFGLILTIFSWVYLPNDQENLKKMASEPTTKTIWHLPIILAFIAYLFFGYGAVPHLLYMVDYMETMLKSSIYIANLGWLIYGIGNTIGSPIFGYLSKHFGIRRMLMVTYFIATISILILFSTHHPWIGLLSYAFNGIVANSIVSLTSSYLTTLAPHSKQTHFWGIFTVFVAVAQTSGSAIMANWVGSQAGFNVIFITSSLAMLLAAMAIFMTRREA